MAGKKLKTLDDARVAYLEGKITAQEYSSLIRKNTIVDHERQSIQKETKKIERKLATV
jgi:hypothetical protein